ncbi:MAG: hypothetical protein INQ03_08575 [Candidatus Heimdallarchaeota archaeon]|nr:hypothetical protein [Candidatus Heimdallarchaeota archaeon]
MYLMGHLGSAFLSSKVVERFKKIRINKYYLGFGVMFPDMIDKSIGSFLFSNGRWIGHTLIFWCISLLLSLYLVKKFPIERIALDQSSIITFFSASLLHLLGDWGIDLAVLFWPFLGPFPPGATENFLYGFHDTKTVFLEILGTAIIVGVGVVEQWKQQTWLKYIGLWILYLSMFGILYFLLVIN